MAQMPKWPETATELLTSDYERIEPFLNKIWGPFIGSVLGFGSVCAVNFGVRRPIMSGLQKHAAMTVIGGCITTYLNKNKHEYYAEKDAVLRHYIQLHPEDFPMPTRRKYEELLEPWIPIR